MSDIVKIQLVDEEIDGPFEFSVQRARRMGMNLDDDTELMQYRLEYDVWDPTLHATGKQGYTVQVKAYGGIIEGYFPYSVHVSGAGDDELLNKIRVLFEWIFIRGDDKGIWCREPLRYSLENTRAVEDETTD